MKNFFKGISLSSIAAGALAAVTSMLLASQIGIYGSAIGVGVLEPKAYAEAFSSLVSQLSTGEALAGMAEAVDRKTGTYSKGMKQRLGIADILMKDPEVLIMDEPTNGIDPEGMRELMVLIRELAEKDGRTILISSHQLHQIQQICDRVGIFVSGSLVACGEIGELGKQIEQEAGYCFEVGADPGGERLLERLLSFEGVREAKLEEDICVVRAAQDMRGQIARELSGEGFALTHLRRRGGDLDEIYAKYFEKAGEKHAGKRENGKPGARRRA